MTEEALFAAALERPTPAERVAFLAEACGGDAALRRRVEALLESHEYGGEFLKTPAIQLAAGASSVIDGDTEANPNVSEAHEDNLSFLAPSQQPGSLGRLGHYEIQEVIGRGGMGIVLRALDEKLHRVAAIKVMAAQLATNATARRRFTREAQAAAAVTHDHIVTIYAVEEAAGLPYLAMQYVAGTSLQERIDRSGPLQLDEILRIGMQTASGLAAAHAQGLIHRDIKPANILLENGVERVKLTDFGLARAADDANLTQSGMVTGTPHYMSPEQAQGAALDQCSDLFSLGSVMYAMCTGRAPFRASGTVAVLKRVCDETPTPVSQINSAIPAWLAAIIEKLHAKDPAERYQSAAEVAEVLGRHLAHVQHPSVMPLPQAVAAATEPDSAQQVRRSNRRGVSVGTWRTVAAVLLVLLGGLSLTEATGFTRLVPTVIRVWTPEGTLVVEMEDDPAVKVTIEGDGGLVITGAGPHEVRLKPGSYKLQAERNGQKIPMETELVSIAKGGREIVRVKLEKPPAPVVAKTEQGAFVLLTAGQERKFETLAEAVQRAADGDTIEIRGNGPFVTEPIETGKQALTIRAGAGYRPVIKLSPNGLQTYEPMLLTSGVLVLEGLEFQRLGQKWSPGEPRIRIVSSDGSALRVANCRFWSDHTLEAYNCDHIQNRAQVCEIRNCEFLSPGEMSINAHGNTLILDNCVHVGRLLLGLTYPNPVEVRLNRNTLVTREAQAIHFSLPTKAERGTDTLASRRARIEATDNVIDAHCILLFGEHGKGSALEPDEAESIFPRVLSWQGRYNVYEVREHFLIRTLMATNLAYDGPKNLSEWKKFWASPETGSAVGVVRFQGGDLLRRLMTAPEKLTPDDFRLRPDSAGYRAGKDGKDLGADVDLVGPGAAYERWKKTPEYQEWLEDTKQVKQAEWPTAEPKAFVVLGGNGVAERRFDTLAEALLTSTDGDTIEVRGNGPFLIDATEVQHALTIRAGAGCRPVFVVNPESKLLFYDRVFVSSHPLRLEGLEFRGSSKPYRILYSEGPLWVANCRLQDTWVCIEGKNACVVRNCELLAGRGAGLAFQCNSDVTSEVANCILAGSINLVDENDITRGATVRFGGNTFVSPFCPTFFHALYQMDTPADQVRNHSGGTVHVVVTENIVSSKWGVFFFGPNEAYKPFFDAAGAEAWIPRRVKWDEERNIFRSVQPYITCAFFNTAGENTPIPLTRGKDFADWNRFWGLKGTGSSEGVIRFHGGDLFSKAIADVAKLTPDDFRLRPDSAGYRASKDGKDLGADVDLVGPGPAYERWKKTPEYEMWMKETGQQK